MLEQVRDLQTVDGVVISAVHRSGPRELCLVVVHGFTGGWREERVQAIIDRLDVFGGVVAIDMRGHGHSGGATSLGDSEVLDVAVAVAWARELGYLRVVTVGFSLGGAVVIREAALAISGDGVPTSGRVDAVVSVSAPAFWYYRGTRITRRVHRLVSSRAGRTALRMYGTRISSREWTPPLPVAPHAAAAMLGDVPLLVVHGDVDRYFPIEHANALHDAARSAGTRSELWLEPDFGHAETAISAGLVTNSR